MGEKLNDVSDETIRWPGTLFLGAVVIYSAQESGISITLMTSLIRATVTEIKRMLASAFFV